jgi:stalled ribosome alternative rescue factor ArfA
VKRRTRHPNPIAKAVRTVQFRQRIVKSQKGAGAFKRKPKHKGDEE